jgi:hypothetical protein
VRAVLETELARPEFPPNKNRGSNHNYRQRSQLLPIHAGNITSKKTRATKDFCHEPRKNALLEVQRGKAQKNTKRISAVTRRLFEALYLF